MRKIILLIAVLFMTAPAMAANVTVSCEVGGDDCNEVTVSYETDGTLIRAFGLTIQLNDPNVGISQVVPVDANYRIYPSQIEIDDGEVTAYNTPYDPCYLGDSNLTIEMGSLYTTDSNYAGDANAGYNMIPGQSGVLLKFYVDTADSGITFDVNEDPLSGGVVLEDPCETAVVTISGDDEFVCDQPCMAITNPDFNTWDDIGRPDCWCYEWQCKGQVDGLLDFGGTVPVYMPDFDLFLPSFGQPDSASPNICANIDHLWDFGGTVPVYMPDFDIFLPNFGQPASGLTPPCGNPPDPNFNFWCTPGACP